MGFVIGGTDEFSTWSKCRTPIYKGYLGAVGNSAGDHNFSGASDALMTEASTFFRCAYHFYLEPWTSVGGFSGVAWYGPFANPASFFPLPSTQFFVGAYEPNPDNPYAYNNLDDVEVQAYWVGRSVVIDTGTYAMAYSALNGVNGSSQTIASSTEVISFDL
jgi:hypothetical protein